MYICIKILLRENSTPPPSHFTQILPKLPPTRELFSLEAWAGLVAGDIADEVNWAGLVAGDIADEAGLVAGDIADEAGLVAGDIPGLVAGDIPTPPLVVSDIPTPLEVGDIPSPVDFANIPTPPPTCDTNSQHLNEANGAAPKEVRKGIDKIGCVKG